MALMAMQYKSNVFHYAAMDFRQVDGPWQKNGGVKHKERKCGVVMINYAAAAQRFWESGGSIYGARQGFQQNTEK